MIARVNGRKYENFLQLNISWLTSLRRGIILVSVLASLVLAMTLL